MWRWYMVVVILLIRGSSSEVTGDRNPPTRKYFGVDGFDSVKLMFLDLLDIHVVLLDISNRVLVITSLIPQAIMR